MQSYIIPDRSKPFPIYKDKVTKEGLIFIFGRILKCLCIKIREDIHVYMYYVCIYVYVLVNPSKKDTI